MSMFHLSALLTVVRHGEKDHAGELTDFGAKQAFAKGLDIPYLGGKVQLFHSGVDRVKRTTEIISQSLPYSVTDVVTGKGPEQIQNISSYPITALEELHFDLDRKIQTQYFSPWNETVTQEAKDRLVQEYLEYEDIQPERGASSPKSLAQRLSFVLLQSISEAIKTPFDECINVVFGTHEPVIMSFLFYALNEFLPGPKSFVADVGGSVFYAEGFDIRIYQNEDGEYRAFLFFRTVFYEFTIEELSAFTVSPHSGM